MTDFTSDEGPGTEPTSEVPAAQEATPGDAGPVSEGAPPSPDGAPAAERSGGGATQDPGAGAPPWWRTAPSEERTWPGPATPPGPQTHEPTWPGHAVPDPTWPGHSGQAGPGGYQAPGYPGGYRTLGDPGQPGYPYQGQGAAYPGHTQPGYPGQGAPGGPAGPGATDPRWQGGAWGWIPPSGGWGMPPHGSAPGAGGSRRSLAIVAGSVLTVIAVLVGVLIGYSVWNGSPSTPAASRTPASGGTFTFGNRGRSGSTSTTSSKISSAAGAPSDIAAIATKVDPGLVDVNTVLGDSTAEAAGTGQVLTSTGKVLTNNHVIEGATSISVTDLGNSKTYSASVIGYDRTSDVAVIQLKGASGLKTVTLGNSSTVSVGEAVVGIGNAGGTGGNPSKAGGSVTALNQAITASDEGSGTTEHLTGLIQSNANIEPGDSGGPLVNTSGQVVGMDTAASAAQGFTFNGAATGQGYSIPINTAINIAKQIEAGKSSKTVHIGATAFLGVAVLSSSSATRGATGGRFGFGSRTPTATPSGTSSGGTTSQPGALVTRAITGTPAQQAGLAHGDLITALGGTTVTSPDSLTKVIEQYHPGATVKVVWTNTSGQSQSATVTLTSGPAG